MHDGQRDWQVIGRALLADIGWCQIDNYFSARKEAPHLFYGRFNPENGFFDCGIGEAY